MSVFQLKDENAEDIVDLARYAYSEEGGGGSFDGEIGDLRSLVCQFTAVNSSALSSNAGFIDLIGGVVSLPKISSSMRYSIEDKLNTCNTHGD